jgi:hypothetical protein
MLLLIEGAAKAQARHRGGAGQRAAKRGAHEVHVVFFVGRQRPGRPAEAVLALAIAGRRGGVEVLDPLPHQAVQVVHLPVVGGALAHRARALVGRAGVPVEDALGPARLGAAHRAVVTGEARHLPLGLGGQAPAACGAEGAGGKPAHVDHRRVGEHLASGSFGGGPVPQVAGILDDSGGLVAPPARILGHEGSEVGLGHRGHIEPKGGHLDARQGGHRREEGHVGAGPHEGGRREEEGEGEQVHGDSPTAFLPLLRPGRPPRVPEASGQHPAGAASWRAPRPPGRP